MNPSNPLERIETEHLVGERLCERHLDELRLVDADPRMQAWLGGVVRDEDETRAGIARCDEQWERNGIGWWCLFARDDGRFVGRGGVRWMEFDGTLEHELAWSVVPEEQGRGFATEMAREFVRIAFDERGADSVLALTQPHNVASRRVMEKLGMVHERDGTHADLPHVFYRLRR